MSVDTAILHGLERILGDPSLSAEAKVHHVRSSLLAAYNEILRMQLLQQLGPVVQAGPFAGMTFHERQVEGCYLPKLLGCYEEELHPTLFDMAQRASYERIINIGCSEGYYAVGLARLFPEAHVFAFDVNETGQAACRQLATKNGVSDRVQVAGLLTADALNTLIQGRTLLVCDIEGAEFDLLNPEHVPALRHADMIVELHHDYIQKPELGTRFLASFEPSHTVEQIPHQGRNPNAFEVLKPLSQLVQWLCVCEYRPCPTPWGVFKAKSL